MEVRERYFVRAREDAAEKGPYGRDQLASSFEKGLLAGGAEVRAIDGDDWVPLASVFRPQPKPPAFVAPMEQRTAPIDEGDPYEGRRGGTVMAWLGVVTCVAGILATLVSTSTPGGHIFIGLIITGVIVFLKGLARSSIS